MSESKVLPQYIAALAATCGAFAVGAALGWTSPSSPRLTKQEEYGFSVSEEEFSWVGSSMNIGAALICIPIGAIMNLFGRKKTMLMFIVPFLIGWAMLIWAQNVAMLIVGRFFIGIVTGAYCVVAPMYIGETAQKEIRGTLGTFFQLLLTIGILLAYSVGAGVSVFWLSIICGALPIAFGSLFMWMPETPVHLVNKNKDDEAMKSIKWLRGENYDGANEIAELQNEKEEQSKMQYSAKDLLSRTSTKKSLLIMAGLNFFQQLSGINAVIFYTNDIFEAANTGISSELATIMVGVTQVVVTLVATLVVDRLGRRFLLLISSSFMCICTTVMGVYFFMKNNDESSVESLGWLPVVSLCLFIVAFSLGFGPLIFVVLGEMFAADVKGLVGGLPLALNWGLAFVVTKTFSNLVNAIKIGPTFWVFSVFSLLGTFFVFFMVPETKGKSLAEIQTMLSGKNESEDEKVADVRL